MINPKTNDLSFKYNQPVKYLYESLQPHMSIGHIGWVYLFFCIGAF